MIRCGQTQVPNAVCPWQLYEVQDAVHASQGLKNSDSLEPWEFLHRYGRYLNVAGVMLKTGLVLNHLGKNGN